MLWTKLDDVTSVQETSFQIQKPSASLVLLFKSQDLSESEIKSVSVQVEAGSHADRQTDRQKC